MEIIVCDNYQEASKTAAKFVMKEIILNPELNLGLATGTSPIGLYKNLIEGFKSDLVTFENVVTFNLDEYIGIDKLHPQSYYSFMHEYLFKHIDIKEENINIPDNNMQEIDHLAERYNKILEENIIDLQILGIGRNGHIGFNEPGTPLSNETFIVELDLETRQDNARFFKSLEEVPTHAITMGIKNIMRAKKIIMLAQGAKKADSVNKMVNGDITKEHPASILQLHPDITVILDKEAASKLSK